MAAQTLPEAKPEAVRIFILTETHLYGRALGQVLGDGGLHVVGMSGGLASALDAIFDLRPDIVLFDLTVPNSVFGLAEIAEAAPEVKVIAVAPSPAAVDLMACARARVAGYVSAEEDPDALVIAIEGVARGELRCSPRMATPFMESVATLATAHSVDPPENGLTKREHEVLQLIATGLSNKEIALRLSIELPTVKNHVHNILRKLEVHRRTEAMARVRPDPLHA